MAWIWEKGTFSHTNVEIRKSCMERNYSLKCDWNHWEVGRGIKGGIHLPWHESTRDMVALCKQHYACSCWHKLLWVWYWALALALDDHLLSKTRLNTRKSPFTPLRGRKGQWVKEVFSRCVITFIFYLKYINQSCHIILSTKNTMYILNKPQTNFLLAFLLAKCNCIQNKPYK